MISLARRIALALVLVAVGAALGRAAWADRAAADYFTQRGEKELKERKWADAEAQFRKALDEEAKHLPAEVGLGEALLGQGSREAAVETWRRALEDAKSATPLPAAWNDAVARAKKRLAELDAAGTALDQVVEKQVADLLALAGRWMAKDPETAVRAARSVLALRPDHPKAAALLSQIGEAGIDWKTLLSGKQTRNWTYLVPPQWQVLDNAVVGETRDQTMQIVTTDRFGGEFDLRFEVKIQELFDEGAGFLVLGMQKAPRDALGYGLFRGALILWDLKPDRTLDESTLFSSAPATTKPSFDPKDWTTYEIRFRAKAVHLLVNGVEVAVRERGADRDEGPIGIQVQRARVAFRKLEIARR